MAELKLEGLTKSFGPNRVVDGVSLEVEKGGFCILLGPSGCGKSTILRLIAGLEAQDSGSIFIGGIDVGGLTPRERDIAMVFQSYALYPHMSAFDNMAFPLKVRKTPRAAVERKVRGAAGLLGIEGFLDRKPSELSGGQRQRVALGRAIVREPRLFLFDEPLSNLDAKLRSSMRIELARLHRKLGTTMLYVTHDQIEAMTLGEKIVLLEGGVVQQVGPPSDIYERPSNLFVASFIGTPQMNLFEGRIEAVGGEAHFRSGRFSIALGDRDLLNYAGLSVTAGVRPEGLYEGEGPLKGEVELVEHVGSEAYVYIRERSGARVAARVKPGFRESPGDAISLAFEAGAVHLFRDGKRI